MFSFDLVKYISLMILTAYVVSNRLGLKKIFRSKMSDAGEGFLSYTMWSNIGATADIPIKHFDVFLLSYISYEVVAVYKVFKQFIQMISLFNKSCFPSNFASTFRINCKRTG